MLQRHVRSNPSQGLRYDKPRAKWVVWTLTGWGKTRRLIGSANTEEEATTIRAESFPRLIKAIAAGTFELELATIRAALTGGVR